MRIISAQKARLFTGRDLFFYLFITAFIAVSCSVPDKNPADENRPLDLDEMNPIGNDPRVETLFNIDESGTSEFETTDTEFVTEDGYTLIYLDDEIINPFNTWSVSVAKESGNRDAGYGLVFGAYDSQGASGVTMLVLLINTRGEYLFGEIRDSNYYEVIPWTASDALTAGMNQSNNLKVTRDDESDTFAFYFNNTFITSYTETAIPYHWGGQNGYVVVTSSEENFPAEPVRVLFTNN